MRAPAELLIVTDRHSCTAAGHSLPSLVAAAADAGARRFLFREKDLDPEPRRELAAQCVRAAAGAGAALIIASDPALARELGGLEVHLASTDPAPPEGVVWGRSCHSTPEVARARDEGAAYVTVSPVFVSAAKPGYGPALGVAGLRRAVTAAQAMPVLALGGISAATCASCIATGATGVAVMSFVMSAPSPAAAVAALCASLNRAAHPVS